MGADVHHRSSKHPIRVVQWTTGGIAVEAVHAIAARDDIEIVGVYAYSEAKVGRDLGELCGLGESTGVLATDDVDTLLALQPDCVVYTPLYPDVAELVRLLGAGVNVVTTAEMVTGRMFDDEARSAIDAACERGDATLFGTGMNPGWAQMLAGAAAGLGRRVRHVKVTESVDVSLFAGDANFDAFGWGRPAGDPDHVADLEDATKTFAEGADLLGRILGLVDPELRFSVAFAHATKDLDLPGRPIAEGTVAGMDLRWEVLHEGAAVAELNSRFVMGTELDTGWVVEHGYRIEVDGDPKVNVYVEIMPTDDDLADLTTERMKSLGLRMAAVPTVDAIPVVCAAPPGLRTYADLPLITANVGAN